jgi:hypothetical protein
VGGQVGSGHSALMQMMNAALLTATPFNLKQIFTCNINKKTKNKIISWGSTQ